ncbi:MAG: hypothetical protein KJ947_10890 [Alphaproteobacteria bacterium]|nr:hypothetical protein [Alphaproteobacteria bacterium]MBU1550064.1 hypothetical protein [Alphaproteobacteria bacterium]MBU2337134.1 hypothetical protein [Alphaproteobacteria bacterium]MBU2389465.1 hypothetical protein [Alphaproteobacteria bacterium]|tara:strand:- start:445 stop:966 length:522 start_codon:yes stop_codon:yes gene_type:complete
MQPEQLRIQLVEIYTLLSRAPLNKEYYGVMLSRNQRLSTWFDTLIAIGTTGSGLSALTIWNTYYGAFIWGILSAASAVLALTKPIIQLNKKVERLSRLFVGHSDNYASLLILVSRIKRRGILTEEMLANFEASELRFLELAKEDDPTPDRALVERCEETVRRRHPPESAWYPT